MRILIKISGESLKKDDCTLSSDNLWQLAKQIKKINEQKIGIGIVIGGGNIARGREFQELGFDRVDSDQIGMLATVINCLALASSLDQVGVKSKVMSAIGVANTEDIDVKRARELIEDNQVVLFAGGVGQPYFSTDSACALRAAEIKADKILMAKKGTDGVYNKDPNKYVDAVRYESLTYDQILDEKLGVMDDNAALLCRDNRISAFVFNANEPDAIVLAAQGKITGTIIQA